MFNKCLIHLFDCTCLNMMCVCSTKYGSTQIFFDNFICIWKWFLSLFVFMFSAYFIFHCLNMFCVEKQVSLLVLATLASTSFGYSFWQLTQSWNASREFIQKLLQFTRDSWKFLRLSHDSLVVWSVILPLLTNHRLFIRYCHHPRSLIDQIPSTRCHDLQPGASLTKSSMSRVSFKKKK